MLNLRLNITILEKFGGQIEISSRLSGICNFLLRLFQRATPLGPAVRAGNQDVAEGVRTTFPAVLAEIFISTRLGCSLIRLPAACMRARGYRLGSRSATIGKGHCIRAACSQ